jgi:hypothetical protein
VDGDLVHWAHWVEGVDDDEDEEVSDVVLVDGSDVLLGPEWSAIIVGAKVLRKL